MEKRRLDRKDWLIILIIFAAALIPRLVFALQMLPLFYVNDELATISAFTLLYPADWSEVLTSQTSYYGGGFTILFTPLFYLIRNPVTIYHVMITIYCILQALIVLPAYAITRKHFCVENRFFSAFLSLAVSYVVTRRSDNITNETALYILIWIIFYVLLELVSREDNRKDKRILSVVLALLYTYALSIHERSLAFIGMFAFLYLFYLYVYHKSLVSIPFFAVPFAGGYVLARLLKKAILAANYSAVLREVTNTSVGRNFSNLSLLKDPGNWKALFYGILGSLTTSSLVTGCVILIGCIIAVMMLVQFLVRPSSARNLPDENSIERKLFVGIIFFFSGIAAVIIMQTTGWLPTLEAAIERGMHYNTYALKILTYIRYYGICLGPGVLLTVLYLFYHKEKAGKIVTVNLPVAAFLTCFWIFVLYRYISHSTAAREAWAPFGGTAWYNNTNGYIFYVVGAVVLAAMAAMLFIFVRERWFKSLVVILCAFYVFQYVRLSVDLDLTRSAANENYVNTWEACEEAHLTDLMDEMYVNEVACTRYQFLFYDSKIHPYLPDYEEEGIVLTSSYGYFSDAFDYGWKLVDLDAEKTHLIFVKGEEILEALDERGISYTDHYDGKRIFYPEDFNTVNAGSRSASTSAFRTNGGTYCMYIDGEADVKVTDTDGTVLCSGSTVGITAEEQAEGFTFSVSAPTRMTVSVSVKDLVTEEENMPEEELAGLLQSVLNDVRIVQVSDDYIFGMDFTDDLADITAYVEEKQEFPELVYCFNGDSSLYDMSYFAEQVAPVSVSVCNEMQLMEQKKEAYVLMSIQQDFLSLAKEYVPVKINSHYILLEKTKETGDGYVDTEALKSAGGKTVVLPTGTYTLRFSGIEEKYLDGAEPLGYRLAKGTDGTILARGYLSPEETAETSVYFSSEMSGWVISLLYGEETVSCDKIEIARPVSALDTDISENYAGLIRIINDAGYNGTVLNYVYSDTYDLNLLKDCMENRIGTGADVEMFPMNTISAYSSDNTGIPADADWMIVPKLVENVYPFLPDYIAAAVGNRTALLVKNTQENAAMLERAGVTPLSEGSTLYKAFYDMGNEKSRRVSVPRGTFKVTVSVDGDTTDRDTVSLFRSGDKTLITSGTLAEGADEIVLYARSIEGFNYLIPGPAANSAGLLGDVSETELAKYSITSVERISDDLLFGLSECKIGGNGTYNAATDTITGSGNVKIRSEVFRVLKDRTYLISATVKGKPVSASLSSVNVEFRNEIVNAHTEKNNITDNGDGTYTVFMRVIPGEQRSYNQIILSASFEGDFEILELRIGKEE